MEVQRLCKKTKKKRKKRETSMQVLTALEGKNRNSLKANN